MSPLLDDLATPLAPEEAERRKLLGFVGTGALAAAAAGTVLTTIRFLEPDVFFEPDTRFSVGRPEEIEVGTVVVLQRQKVYLVRGAAGFVALQATCTHLGCMTRFEAEARQFACPCHGSRFSLEGKVMGGPAPRPLPRLHVALEQGLLVIDTRKRAPDDFVLPVTS